MAVDLNDLIGALQTEVNPPGTDLFPAATDDEWLSNLVTAFWEAKIFGFFSAWTAADEIVSAQTSGGDEIGRDSQQLIVLFAAARIIRNELTNTNTSFRAQAGPVEFEVQNSANLLIAILHDIRSKVDLAMAAIGTINSTTVAYVDSLIGREDSIYYGDTFVARGGSRFGTYGGNW